MADPHDNASGTSGQIAAFDRVTELHIVVNRTIGGMIRFAEMDISKDLLSDGILRSRDIRRK